MTNWCDNVMVVKGPAGAIDAFARAVRAADPTFRRPTRGTRTRSRPWGIGYAIYYRTEGTPRGRAVLFVHGGPGAGVQGHDRTRLADCPIPVVFVDQRGAGRSTYDDRLRDNTTAHLIADVERVRERLGIDR